ncbi:hypothetical protein LINGRAHAP2_LOCUS17799, partial [Linum grandiflorum]
RSSTPGTGHRERSKHRQPEDGSSSKDKRSDVEKTSRPSSSRNASKRAVASSSSCFVGCWVWRRRGRRTS